MSIKIDGVLHECDREIVTLIDSLRARLEAVEQERSMAMRWLLHEPIEEVVKLRQTVEVGLPMLKELLARHSAPTPEAPKKDDHE